MHENAGVAARCQLQAVCKLRARFGIEAANNRYSRSALGAGCQLAGVSGFCPGGEDRPLAGGCQTTQQHQPTVQHIV